MQTHSEVDGQIVAVAGEDSVERIHDNLWIVDWPRWDIDKRACLFSYLLSLQGDFLMDLEDELDGSPVPLVPVPDLQGVGFVCRVRAPVDANALMRWLDYSVWLALSGGPQHLREQIVLRWSVTKLFRHPLELLDLMEQCDSAIAVASYYDGDSWLVGKRQVA